MQNEIPGPEPGNNKSEYLLAIGKSAVRSIDLHGDSNYVIILVI